MSSISSSSTTETKRSKKQLLFIFALLIIFANIGFFIWLFTGEKTKYFNDADEDGFGDPKDVKMAKIRPWGYVNLGSDPDDNNPCVPDSLGVACKEFNASKTKEPAPDQLPPLDDSSDTTTIVSPIKKDEIVAPPKVVSIVENKDSDRDSVDDISDSCPTRKGPSSNKGCPEYQISLPSEVFINENFEAKIVGGALLPNDKVNWQTDTNIKQANPAQELGANGNIVGIYKIGAELSNSDGFEMSLPNKTIFLKIRPNVLADLFKPFYIYGSALSSKATNITVLKSKADDAKNQLKQHIKDGILSGATVYDDNGGIVNDLETFINADIIGGAVKGGLKVSNVKYSTKTGKITEIHLQ